MINSKQRSYLRGLANNLQPIFQLGKNGFDDNFFKQLDEALEARELIKITLLPASGYSPREASDEICTKLGCEGVQAIGSKLIIYRKSIKKPKIELPEK